LAYVAGQLKLPQSADENKNASQTPKAIESNEDLLAKPTPSMLVLATLDLPENMTDTFRAHQPIFVGDVILAEFRRLLQREGIPAEFVDGALICNDTVSIRKVNSL
jgi:hypothetical protein